MVTRYFPGTRTAEVRLAAPLRRGDLLHFRGPISDYYQRVERLERDHAPVSAAEPGAVVSIATDQWVREGDRVTRIAVGPHSGEGRQD